MSINKMVHKWSLSTDVFTIQINVFTSKWLSIQYKSLKWLFNGVLTVSSYRGQAREKLMV